MRSMKRCMTRVGPCASPRHGQERQHDARRGDQGERQHHEARVRNTIVCGKRAANPRGIVRAPVRRAAQGHRRLHRRATGYAAREGTPRTCDVENTPHPCPPAAGRTRWHPHAGSARPRTPTRPSAFRRPACTGNRSGRGVRHARAGRAGATRNSARERAANRGPGTNAIAPAHRRAARRAPRGNAAAARAASLRCRLSSPCPTLFGRAPRQLNVLHPSSAR